MTSTAEFAAITVLIVGLPGLLAACVARILAARPDVAETLGRLLDGPGDDR